MDVGDRRERTKTGNRGKKIIGRERTRRKRKWKRKRREAGRDTMGTDGNSESEVKRILISQSSGRQKLKSIHTNRFASMAWWSDEESEWRGQRVLRCAIKLIIRESWYGIQTGASWVNELDNNRSESNPGRRRNEEEWIEDEK